MTSRPDELETRARHARAALEEIRLEAGRLYRSLGGDSHYREMSFAQVVEKAAWTAKYVKDFNDLAERQMADARKSLDILPR